MRLIKNIFLELSKAPMSGYTRQHLIKMAGVKMIYKSNEKKLIHIGKGVRFDTIYPEYISIGNGTTIATGALILSHFMVDPQIGPRYKFYKGFVSIGRDCFIGANAIISQPVKIGNHSIIAAGSVVTQDIPELEIWGGVPAKFVKKRIIDQKKLKSFEKWIKK